MNSIPYAFEDPRLIDWLDRRVRPNTSITLHLESPGREAIQMCIDRPMMDKMLEVREAMIASREHPNPSLMEMISAGLDALRQSQSSSLPRRARTGRSSLSAAAYRRRRRRT